MTDTTNMKTKRAQAAKLLRRYEKLRREIMILEPEMRVAVIDYGKTKGLSFMRPETLRIELDMEAELNGRKAA
jgi:hypothetical protein